MLLFASASPAWAGSIFGAWDHPGLNDALPNFAAGETVWSWGSTNECGQSSVLASSVAGAADPQQWVYVYPELCDKITISVDGEEITSEIAPLGGGFRTTATFDAVAMENLLVKGRDTSVTCPDQNPESCAAWEFLINWSGTFVILY